MNTASPRTSTSFDEIKGYLNQIGQYLFQVETPWIPESQPSAEQRYLNRLNGLIQTSRQQYLDKARAHYQPLKDSNLHSEEGQQLLTTLKSTLNDHLLELDLRHQIDAKPRKSFMTYDAGFTALEHEARLGVQDRLLHPQEAAIVERAPLFPTLRPGLYALQFSYQENSVELAGAFVVTEKNSPQASDLSTAQDVGQVLLFTPARGIESFDSLALLDNHLLQSLDHPSGQREFKALLPVRYHALSAAGIWPLQLSPIVDKPLFEHTDGALIDRRTQDIDHALSLVDNPAQDPAHVINALDQAITAAMPDLTARLELRAQTLLERCLRYSAPDWYRSASEAARATLAEHLNGYNQARQTLLNLLAPATTPQSLARHQWLERLSDELDIHDLEPEHLQLSTRRFVANVGHYDHQRNLIELALRGLHSGDESRGSPFRTQTTLTYNDAPLPEAYQDVTPTWLAQQMTSLQPRIDFANVQRALHARAEVSTAIEQMLDRRINALAYTAVLQGHISEDDFQLIQHLRQGTDPRLNADTLGASSLELHDAQLLDLWVLRRTNASGTVDRILLCTPEAPREQQFHAFDTELACQQHILGWTLGNGLNPPPGSLTDYLITRLPLRFRNSMKNVLSGLTFKFHAQEYKEVAFINTGTHAECLKSMARHVLVTRIDDYAFSTPGWYRSTTHESRRILATRAENAEGALDAYSAHPFSETQFPDFNAFLHENAKRRLNEMLGRPRNDVDPDTVWVYSPASLVGTPDSPPMTYTRLYRDGYADGVGFLDEKFSRSATFKGPEGIDLRALTAEKVARSVTGAWIGERYIDKVRSELLKPDDSAYAFRRDAVLAIIQQQLLSAALESRLKGDIANVDLQWLEQSISSMADTSQATRGTYAIHRLLVDGDWVIDNYLFSHGTNPVLLYTPQAPDGVSFREARQFNYLLKKTPGMIAYFTNRVGVSSQVRVRQFLEEARQGLPEDLDSSSTSPARYDSTRTVPPISDLRQALYNMKLQRKIDDVYATTVNRTQMITGILWTCVEWGVAIATAPFPLLSLSTGLLLAFKDAMLALHAYHQGDTAAALEHFAGYLLNSAGAVLTDLRPALRSLKPLGKLARLPAAKAEPVRAMKLIKALEPAQPTPVGMQSVIFEGQHLWAPNTPDVIGRYLLYRLDPASGKLVSTTRVAAPNAEGVWKRTGVSGGAPEYEALPETPKPLSVYEMPEKKWRDLVPVLDPQVRSTLLRLNTEYDMPPGSILGSAADSMKSLHGIYVQQVERLTTDARNFFTFLDPLPPPAAVPPVEASTSLAQLIDSDAFASNKNLIIGAVPGSIASKQVLIEQMDALVAKGFKRLYLEYLPGDVFRPKLEKLNKGKSWLNIKKHLQTIDTAFGFAEDADFSYVALVRTAQEKKIQIKALDATTSYQLDDSMTMLGTSPSTTPRDNSLRNFYSHKVIQADVADAPDERWIALVDQSRLRTFNETPGLADLQNAVALRIDDVGLDQPVGIWVDTPGSITGDALAKGDYRMSLQTPYKAPAPLQAVAAPGAQHFDNFDIPGAMRDEIDHQSQNRYGLDSRYRPQGQESGKAFDMFVALRKRLKSEAERYFTEYVAPAKPTLPEITAATTPESFLKQIVDGPYPGLILGEAHGQQSCKAFLRTQMKKLSELKFETLYVEHLWTDLHQAQLDAFFESQHLTGQLKAFLKSQDAGHMPFYTGPNTYSEVYQAAAKYKIRIKALDCAASYNLKGISDGDETRASMFNYFATQVIQADQAARGPHKWIAFVGNSHANRYMGVPGLAETLGTVSLNIRDAAPTLSKRIHHSAWETITTKPGWPALRCDFDLDEGVAGMKIPAPFTPVDRSKLSEAGYFLIERPSRLETNLVHRSSTGEIISTPIQVDDKGLFFIDRWGKRDQRFLHQFTLIEMLKADVHLRPAP